MVEMIQNCNMESQKFQVFSMLCAWEVSCQVNNLKSVAATSCCVHAHDVAELSLFVEVVVFVVDLSFGDVVVFAEAVVVILMAVVVVPLVVFVVQVVLSDFSEATVVMFAVYFVIVLQLLKMFVVVFLSALYMFVLFLVVLVAVVVVTLA